MLIPLALALVPGVFADIRADFRDGLYAEVDAAIEANSSPLGKSSEQLAASHVPSSNSYILGIGDPEEYQPYAVECPAEGTTWVRPATSGIGEGEKAYLARRNNIINDAVSKMVAAAGLPVPQRTPTIGLALSGGGYRAMINGMGMTMALMNASDEASKAGTGGWLDAVSYMAGLSGGSWATGSFMANNAPLPTDLIANVWNLDQNLVFPSDGKVAFYTNMLANVKERKKLGFPTAITDYWALALGEHLLPEQYRMAKGANFTVAQIPTTISKFQSANVPFPIIIAAEREINESVVAENATVWEFTPYEFGSWAVGFNNLTQGFFTPIEYMGTSLVDGKANGTCYRGYDQLSFVMGTSSTLFNYGIVRLQEANEDSVVVDAVKSILESVGDQDNDISKVPNPAYKHHYAGDGSKNPLADFEYLTLVDAGETNQNIPMEPLLVRDVDTILAFDNSADTNYSWPNGAALWTTYKRVMAFKEQYHLEDMQISTIPTANTFINKGLNTRPVFFGCNTTASPLIVYIPHYPWTYYSNSTTFKLQYDSADATAQMESAMRSLTLNGTVPTWPKCLACAMTDRANGYTAANRSAECAECFQTWCWDGEVDDSEPSAEYEPVAGVTPKFLVDNNLSTDVRDTPLTTTTKKDDKGNAAAARAPLATFGTVTAALAAVAAGMLATL